jgi:membrane protein DedA with SNARE-associated domain/rhodanese-related sulfurtransferase
MDPVWQHLSATNAYLLLFAVVLADQAGLPIPAAPLLVGAGVLCRGGTLSLAVMLPLCALASLLGHGAWYVAGRRRGAAIIKLLCRLSLEPDACVRRTEELFRHVGPTSLLWVRFIPGLDVLAQPLVAMSGMPAPHYVAITLFGALLWSGVLMGLGMVLGHDVLEALIERAGASLLTLLAVAVVGYVAYKLGVRLLSRSRDVPRLEPEGLQAMLEAGRPLVILDMRTQGECERSGEHIAGSRHLGRLQLRALARRPEPGLGAVVLCECPKEAGSAYMAAVLKRGGWQESWALAGGFSAWKRAGFATQPLPEPRGGGRGPLHRGRAIGGPWRWLRRLGRTGGGRSG